ncbi:MAG: metal-dependent hydrolase, partial [Alphaproteobacteria bacterium]
SEGAAELGISDYGIAPGKPAHFFTIAAENIPDAIGAHPPRKRVFHAGRLVAADGVWSDAA